MSHDLLRCIPNHLWAPIWCIPAHLFSVLFVSSTCHCQILGQHGFQAKSTISVKKKGSLLKLTYLCAQVEFFNNFWCFMKLRPRTLHFWSVLVFTNNHMILSTVNPNIQHIIIECFGHGLVGFLSVLVGFLRTFHRILRTGIPGGWWWTQKHLKMKSAWPQIHKT